MTMKRCPRCRTFKPSAEFHKDRHRPDGFTCWCKSCVNRARNERSYRSGKSLPLGTNPECASFLGIHVAERVLSHVFKHVERMPTNNPGYDFKCIRGYKIDVKSATHPKDKPTMWKFEINRNHIADYFLLVAFNNRVDLVPEHLWLIPGDVVNDHKAVGISQSTLTKWSNYRLPDKLNEVKSCCNILKGTA